MNKDDAREAEPIVNVTLDALLTLVSSVELRTAVGFVKANALLMLQYDAIDQPLIRCFDLAFTNGINLYQIESVRRVTLAQPAVSVGAVMVRDTLIELAFATEGYVISNMVFSSRQDVERIKAATNDAFKDTEEEVADQMDSMTWRAILKVHAAIIMHLTETARPLPRMLAYRFNMVMPSVVLAHRLYADASRADELRDENKIVHPAFCLREGQALSA